MNPIDGLSIEGAQSAIDARKAESDEVGQADFLELLVAQLSNQDPLNPQDSAEFASQLAQFSSVEQLVGVRAGIDELVAAAALTTAAGGSTGDSLGVDPTNLVGKEVVVFGSQIEVDAAGSPISMPIRTVDTAVEATVRIRDESGSVRYQGSILPVVDGEPVALRSGDHEFVFDPREYNLPEGVYAIEFSAKGPSGGDVTVLPTISGIVTGALIGSDPKIRVGNRIFSVNDVLEVRLPGSAAISQGSTAGAGTTPSASGASGSLPTGGGQSVYDLPTPGSATRTAFGPGL